MIVHPWQTELLKKLSGVKLGELQMISHGRQLGKSMFGAQALQRLIDDLNGNPVSDLKLSEGTVYGSSYYCVEPVGGSWREMEAWVLKTCGESTGSIWAEEKYKHAANAGERWYGNNRKFWFREEQDRTMFVLKWR
jgi:hypothetical protein